MRSHFLRNIIALGSSVALPTSLGSFPYNIQCPTRLCSPCQSRPENLDDFMRLASSSSPSPSDEDKLSHSLLEGHFPPTRSIPSSSIQIGGPICSTRTSAYAVCADLVLLHTSSSSGTCFILTDQLDGETEQKLRVAVPAMQIMPSDYELLNLDVEIYGASLKMIALPICFILLLLFPQRMCLAKTFTRTLARSRSTRRPGYPRTRCQWSKVSMVNLKPLSAENMLWANAVLAVGSGMGSVVYTGSETRSDEHEPFTDKIWTARHGDRPTC